MALETVRNVGDTPVVIDRAGRVLAIGGYAPAIDVTVAPARGLVERRAIKVIEPRDDEHVSDEARAAFTATAEANAAQATSSSTTGEDTTGDTPATSPPAPAKRAAARRPRNQEA